MMGLAIGLSVVLIALAALHLLWAIGYWIPIRDEEQLAKAVVGTRHITRMPGAVPCALVTLALTFAAILPHNPDFPARNLLMPAIAAVFLARGAAAFVPAWRKRVPQEPFATLDRSVYGPLCLIIGIGYLTLTLGGF